MAATVAPFRGRGEMPRPKVAMRRIKEVLRLKEGLGLSDTAVSRSVRIARSTVKEYLDRAAAAGLNWETVAELSEEELDRRLFAAVDTRHWDRPLPDWEAVEKELRGRGVTLRLLWLEYLSRHPEGYRYTQFCAHFHAWQRHSRPPTMRRQHRAGEALEVDYAGMTLSVIDKGVVRQAQVFVACLPCSDLTYAEASWTQGHEDWLGAHVRAFAYIGGCPKKVIPDYVPGHIIGVLCPLRLCGEPPPIRFTVTAAGHISIRGQRAIRGALARSAKLVFGEAPPKMSKGSGTPPALLASSGC